MSWDLISLTASLISCISLLSLSIKLISDNLPTTSFTSFSLLVFLCLCSTFSVSVSGVSGNCDCNNAYKDFTKIIKEKGLNGFPKTPIPVPTAKTMDTKGFKLGDDSLGVLALKELIALAKKKGLHSVVHIVVCIYYIYNSQMSSFLIYNYEEKMYI